MPTYEYRCTTCANQFEVFARMSDPDPEVCPACNAATLEKVLFPVAVHYKGSGFYSTDYSGSGKGAKASGGSEGGESSGSGGSSDSSSSTSGESSSSSSDSTPKPSTSSD